MRLVLCQSLILGWSFPHIIVLLDRIVVATLILRLDRALVIVQITDGERIAVIKAKEHTPVPRHSDGPGAYERPLQRMQA